MADEVFHQPLAVLAARLAAGGLSSVELTQAFIARKAAVDGRVKAFNSCDEAAA